MKHAVIALALILAGCASKPEPITNINDDIQQGVAELVDYANNNMDIDADKKLLLEGAKNCAAKADALTQACTARIETCEAQTNKAKAERNTLALVLLLLAANAIRKLV